MKRARLIRKIQKQDQQLNDLLAPFRESRDSSLQALDNLNPWLLVATGLAAGLIAGRLGLSSAYTISAMGFKVQPLIQTVITQWMGTTSE
ncbi:hypothetical protein [Pseudomaricurvus sp.]|uniref:hypothetical protein n=1 Tax=Pseudomaricurvus sp. TaxID=2004510 RepID=UPI003F6D92CF